MNKTLRYLSVSKLMDDTRVPMLMGDRFHAKAINIAAALNSRDLFVPLTHIEEDICKSYFALKGNQVKSLHQLHTSLSGLLPNFYKNALRFRPRLICHG